MEAQFAPVFGVAIGDYNGDNLVDIVLSGNSYATDVLTGQYDALKGLYLAGDGSGNFTPKTIQQSGFFIDGDGKGLATLEAGRKHTLILSSQNNGYLRVFSNTPREVANIQAKYLDVYSIITLRNNTRLKREFYYGNGYLSQSSRNFKVPLNDVLRVEIFDSQGKSREEKAKK